MTGGSCSFSQPRAREKARAAVALACDPPVPPFSTSRSARAKCGREGRNRMQDERRRIWKRWILLSVSTLVVVLFTMLPALAQEENPWPLGGSQARCHCPCKLNCANGTSVDCTDHPKDCQDAHCVEIGKPKPKLIALLASLQQPMGRLGHEPWFGLDLPEMIQVGIGATDATTGERSNFVFGMQLDGADDASYTADSSFDAEAYRLWASHIDWSGEVGVSIAAITDPAGWRILDGDLRHLEESTGWRFYLLPEDGSEAIELGRSDSLPAWEAWTYLRSTIAELPDDAFQPGLDAPALRAQLHGTLDTFHMLMNAGAFERAREELEAMTTRSEEWLVPGHRDTAPTLGAMRKIEALLTPAEEGLTQP